MLEKESSSVPSETRYLFWVRLYGVAHDARKEIENYRESHEHSFNEFGSPNDATLHDMLNDVLQDTTALKDALSDDEWVYVAFRRHYEAHPFQDAFRLVWKEGRFVDPKILGTKRVVEDLKGALRRVRESYADDAAAAASMAARVRPHLVKIREGIQDYFNIQKPNPPDGQ